MLEKIEDDARSEMMVMDELLLAGTSLQVCV